MLMNDSCCYSCCFGSISRDSGTIWVSGIGNDARDSARFFDVEIQRFKTASMAAANCHHNKLYIAVNLRSRLLPISQNLRSLG